MEELHENSLNRNFCLLSRRIQGLFMQYILDGRLRAPPEVNLTFLISTFQSGAKTDRRALQSKFKNWAKRMVVENQKLKLACSGKELIPLEDSRDIVMSIHFQGHLSVDRVIKQIQEKYTWSKKNFGLDRDIIVDFIIRNCNNLDCISSIKINRFFKNYRNEDFIKDVILSSESHIHNICNKMQQNPIYNENSSLVCDSLRTNVRDLKNSFPSVLSTKLQKNLTENLSKSTLSKGFLTNPYTDLPKTTNNLLSEESIKSKATPRVVKRSFRKPKNMVDFKALLSAAEQFADYPEVLCKPKTKFLGSLGLAPKQICSQRTLSKVEREKKRKSAQDRQNMIYHQNRKNLRDRNKLNKIKLKEHLQKRAYLDKYNRNSVNNLREGISSCSNSISSNDGSNNVVSSADDSEIEIVDVVSKSDGPEVIEILSSDEEYADESSTKKEGSNSTIVRNGNKSITSMKSILDKSKNLNYHHPSKVDLKFNHLKPSASTSFPRRPETEIRYYPIFKQPFLVPKSSKDKVAILPSSPSPPQVFPKIDKRVSFTENQATKSFMPDKKAILRHVPSEIKTKSFSSQTLLTSGINKIPQGTNVYLLKKQPSGVIKMVPCNRVIAQDKTMSFSNSANHMGSVTKSKFRKISPLPDNVVEIRRKNALDSSKQFINEEMSRLLKCISGMKYAQVHLNIQRSKQRLESQLNSAIALVKNIRRKLFEIEKLEEQVNKNNLTKYNKNMCNQEM